MKRTIQHWMDNTSQPLRKIPADVARIAGGLYQKAKNNISPGKPQKRPMQMLHRPEEPDPEAEQQALTRELERAVHGVYYRQGGIRFYGSCLERYVRVVLVQETDLQQMWAAGYNTCICPMLLQMERLETEMNAIRSEYPQEPLRLSNAALLDAMRRFCRRATEEKLHLVQGWNPEEYRQVLEQYGADLNEQLLIPFSGPGE